MNSKKEGEFASKIRKNSERTRKSEEHVADAEVINKQNNDLLEKITELKEQLLRVQADRENTRKRLEQESINAVKYANSKIIKDMAELRENFRLALHGISTHSAESNAVAEVVKGIKMLEKMFEDIITKHGGEILFPEGMQFDHNEHEAIKQEKSTEPEGTIIQVIKAGCKLHGRILSPAVVIVSSGEGE